MDEKEEMAKLKSMESDVKKMCSDLDEKRADLMADIEKHEKEVAKFQKKLKIVDSSDSFNKMVSLVDEIYTMYVAHYGDSSGLYDSIKLLLDSRAKFSDQAAKK